MTAPPATLGLGHPVQIAYVVDDVHAAAARWAGAVGAGPFVVRDHIPLAHVEHRGRVATFDHSSAYGQWGPVMVELLQDHGTGPSVVRDRFAPGEGGLHHLAFMVDDLAGSVAALVDHGFEVVTRARTSGGVDFCFVDAVDSLGHFLELYERSPRLVEFYAAVAAAAVGWDGTSPVRDSL